MGFVTFCLATVETHHQTSSALPFSLSGLDCSFPPAFPPAGNDSLWGHQGNDQMYGQFGNDKVIGGLGQDNVWVVSFAFRLRMRSSSRE